MKLKLMLLFFVLILLALGGGAAYVYTAPEFEQNPPTITAPKNVIWNGKTPIFITLQDDTGIKSYEMIVSDGKTQVSVAKGKFQEGVKRVDLNLTYPKNDGLDLRSPKLKVMISVNDQSKWNMLKGNSATQIIDISMDIRRPTLSIISNSYMIMQGGSALVILKAEDTNLKELYIQTPKHKFKLQPYRKKGYYAGLIAWEFTQEDFSAKAVAKDKAGNIATSSLTFHLKNIPYKTSTIEAKDRFLDGKIADLAEMEPEYSQETDRLKKLKLVNETMRLKNEEIIYNAGTNAEMPMIQLWKIKPFFPLKNGATIGGFGDKRHYYHGDKNNIVSTSYHVGYDFASTQNAEIKLSNPGKVVYADMNGIYGNMPMIDHGMGLLTLYGHCSEILVNVGDEVVEGQVIAKTGTTGLALGDHLHFGITVQGVEVRPVEWLDPHWIKVTINDIFADADKVIGK